MDNIGWIFDEDAPPPLIPERERWERELWVWCDHMELWVRAPQAKVWRAGEEGKAYPLLRVGMRPSSCEFNPELDIPFVSTFDLEIARVACERHQIALPFTVTLIRYLTLPHRYTTTITVPLEGN